MRHQCLVTFLLLGLSSALPTGSFLRTATSALKFVVPDVTGTSLVGLHYSINKPLVGVSAGDWNFDITSKTDGQWVNINAAVNAKVGDVVNYWILFVVNGEGTQEINLQSIVADEVPTTIPTTPTTPKTTTGTTRSVPTTEPATGTTPTTEPQTGTTASTETPTGTTTAAPLAPTAAPSGQCTSYPCVIFQDDFDTLDNSKWQHEISASGGGNWEFQVYVNNRSNSYIKNGNLYIRPTLTSNQYGESFLSSGTLDIWGNTPASMCTSAQFYGCFRQGNGVNYINPITSARLRTVESFAFRYGRVEIEAKMPVGDWIWPALWLLPKRDVYGGWPASGEIDILESRGNKQLFDKAGNAIGVTQTASTLHWGPHFFLNQYMRTHATTYASSGDFSSSFHTFALEWDDKHITTFVDGNPLLNVDPGAGGFWKLGDFDNIAPGTNNPWSATGNAGYLAPFDTEFYLIMNVAVGGTNGYFPDDGRNGGYPKPWSNTSPTAPRDFWNAKNSWLPTWNGEDVAMQVKSVKVTKLKPDP